MAERPVTRSTVPGIVRPKEDTPWEEVAEYHRTGIHPFFRSVAERDLASIFPPPRLSFFARVKAWFRRKR